uniref:Neuropeptide-like 3 n=1 Tax=Diabrotica virgifera virgifera TaxID=50390 RepID=A0A6P7GV81_DIAVI
MFKLCLVAALLGIAVTVPAPEPKPAPKADPKAQFLAAPVVAAPSVAYSSAYVDAPLAYSSYAAPAVFPGAYSVYPQYSASYVYY